VRGLRIDLLLPTVRGNDLPQASMTDEYALWIDLKPGSDDEVALMCPRMGKCE
jgi:hypothetical protein